MKTGDAVATVAQPIAKGIDWIFETDVQNCVGCDKRRNWLNNFGDKFYDYFFNAKQKGDNAMGKPYTMTIELALDDADSPVDAAAKWKEGVPISITNVRPRPQPTTQGRPENFAGITPAHLQQKGQ